MKFLSQLLPVCVAVCLFLPGCAGYQLGDVKPASYASVQNLHVPTFKNLTLEPRLSSLVTNAVLKELQADGTYRVTTRSNCDAVLVGQISEIRKSQLRADRQDTLQSEELNLFLYVDFHLEDPITGLRIGELKNQEKGENVSWQDEKSGSGQSSIKARNGRVVGEVIQFIDESFQVGERNDLAFAAEDLADKLVSQLANGW